MVLNSSPKQPTHARGTGVVPNPIDVQVGKRIRVRRLLLGMTQRTLAGALGVGVQQVHKYERGINRVGPSRLVAMADTLGVPISYFFGDVRPDGSALTPSQSRASDLMERPETIELFRLYCAIRDDTVRLQVLAIVRAIAEASTPLPEVLRRRRGRPLGLALKK